MVLKDKLKYSINIKVLKRLEQLDSRIITDYHAIEKVYRWINISNVPNIFI